MDDSTIIGKLSQFQQKLFKNFIPDQILDNVVDLHQFIISNKNNPQLIAIACQYHQIDVARLLFKMGCPIDLIDQRVLQQTINYNSNSKFGSNILDCFEFYKEIGIDIHLNGVAIRNAIIKKNITLIKFLLRDKGDLVGLSQDDFISFKQTLQTYRLDHGFTINSEIFNQTDRIEDLLLVYAVYYNDIDLVRILATKHNVNPNFSRGEPLAIACEKSLNKMIRLLLDLGANPRERDEYALRTVVLTNNFIIARELIYFFSVDININFGEPLRIAITSDNYPMTKLLIENGAEPGYQQTLAKERYPLLLNFKFKKYLKKIYHFGKN